MTPPTLRVARRRAHPRIPGEAMTAPENIFAFKLTLTDSFPEIWRRVWCQTSARSATFTT